PALLVPGTAAVASTGAWATVAGAGPVPGAPSPAFLADSDTVDAVFTPGGGNHIPAVNLTGLHVGSAFTLDDASQTALAGITAAITAADADVVLTCATGTCTGGVGLVVAIDTSDGTVTNPLALPAPTKNSGNITCTTIGTTITIPKALLAVLKNATPTAVRVSIFNAAADIAGGNAQSKLPVVAGHGFVYNAAF